MVEMLVERGARRVVSFDVALKAADAWNHPAIEYVQGDLRDYEAVLAAVQGADCVWHNGAAVGPYHPMQLYYDVNYTGTINVINACKAVGCKKVVMSSSPSTRFDGKDVDGLTEAEMPTLPQKSYLAEYARSKALGEMAMRAAACDEFMTCAVAPHQVYGPRDNLFLPNLLEVAGTGKLRIFGNGQNRICFSHVDNYAHGLIIAERVLYPGSPALGKFYIVTDGDSHPMKEGYALFWPELDRAVVFIMGLAYVCDVIGWLLGTKLKLNPFAVKMLTMHRWFKIDAAEKDLNYKPIIQYELGWAETITWFRQNWLPTFDAKAGGYVGKIATQTQKKIDIQTAGAGSATARPKNE
ncbi:NAD(p)-dependent steroid dehydrogenase-like protein [Pavlovales sp. CCMP2436]|nr:NAD(p)-dependent steroid dehydrogenase-like protein [Pavlovales sp. CCMP2436]